MLNGPLKQELYHFVEIADCRDIPTDWSWQQILLYLKTFFYKNNLSCQSICLFYVKILYFVTKIVQTEKVVLVIETLKFF